MKFIICMFLFAMALGAVSASYIPSGWSYPSYSYSSPVVYPYPSYNRWNSGYYGWNRGWNGGWNRGWNGGWNNGWSW